METFMPVFLCVCISIRVYTIVTHNTHTTCGVCVSVTMVCVEYGTKAPAATSSITVLLDRSETFFFSRQVEFHIEIQLLQRYPKP